MENQTSTDHLTIEPRTLKDLTVIELPCFVQSDEKAFDLIGGRSSIAASIGKEKRALSFQFPSEDISRHSIGSRSSDTKEGFLIKIRRKKKDHKDCSFEVLGKTTNFISFDNPADYQFLPSSVLPFKDNKFHNQNQNLESKQEIIEILPKSFCRVKYSREPRFALQLKRSIRLNPTKTKQIKRDNRKNTTLITYDDLTPSEPPHGGIPIYWQGKSETHKGLHLLNLLKKLFDVIPAMDFFQLMSLLNLKAKNHLFLTCLPYVSYKFSGGPFLRNFLRFGFDPRADPSSRFYQRINFRLSSTARREVQKRLHSHLKLDDISNREVNLDTMRLCRRNHVKPFLKNQRQGFGIPIFVFGFELALQTEVQIIQLTHPVIFSFVKKLTPNREFNSKTGWFSGEALDGLRSLVLRLITDKIQEFLTKDREFLVNNEEISKFEKLDSEEYFKDITDDIDEIEDYLNDKTSRYEGLKPIFPHDEEFIPFRDTLFWTKKYLSIEPSTSSNDDHAVIKGVLSNSAEGFGDSNKKASKSIDKLNSKRNTENSKGRAKHGEQNVKLSANSLFNESTEAFSIFEENEDEEDDPGENDDDSYYGDNNDDDEINNDDVNIDEEGFETSDSENEEVFTNSILKKG